MSELSRRGFLGGTAALGLVSIGSATPADAAGAAGCPPPAGLVTVVPGDPRYEDLVLRRINQRFKARPAAFRLVHSTEQVVRAVSDAVLSRQRIGLRSGGHCYENFTGDPAPGVVIDLSGMDAVYFDSARRAFVVEAGATLSEVYQRLYLGWGVTLPAGDCGSVGAGGHVQGGGYGPLSRLHGTVVDHLYAVEVVVARKPGQVTAVVATREPDDPHRELWWAHTGGGGGNFGVVTRYWFRTPGADGGDPRTLLPKPPATVLKGFQQWSWEGLNRESFGKLIRNHGAWHERHSAPGSAYASLVSLLSINKGPGPHAFPGDLFLAAQMDGTPPGAAKMLNDYFAAVSDGVGGRPGITPVAIPWLASATADGQSTAGSAGRWKGKSAYLRRTFTEQQIDTAYRKLSTADPAIGPAMLWLGAYGGAVNAVDPAATALPQRDSIFKAIYSVTLPEPSSSAGDATNLDWLRGFYREMYADTGGVPVPGEVNDGAYINYPDVDLADPEHNTSGVPWYTLYYKENYPRLRRVKSTWDPGNVFRHPLSVQPDR
ncbi:FAD-binding oxidoreductase [Amycolatopsis sp. cmx-11-32]|uniref:FAD-binding oxidoreductase n=1 Tax=Amycolatopsis sp. cmx-11-32 TaxID=2785796 RepID=UPI0039E5B998